MSRLNEERARKLAELAGGEGVIINCGFGHCVSTERTEDGRVKIFVEREPLNADDDRCAALRDFMEETAVAWLRQVAPHRLALGADDR